MLYWLHNFPLTPWYLPWTKANYFTTVQSLRDALSRLPAMPATTQTVQSATITAHTAETITTTNLHTPGTNSSRLLPPYLQYRPLTTRPEPLPRTSSLYQWTKSPFSGTQHSLGPALLSKLHQKCTASNVQSKSMLIRSST